MAGCLALLLALACAVALPTVGAADESGAISGTVTAEGSGMEGVQVCVYAPGDQSTSFGCQSTGPGGSYLFGGLAPGQYTVEFAPAAPYLTQYYSGAETFDLATPVEVISEQVTAGVDATLVKPAPPGPGAISGKVTAAEDGAPVGGVEVCAEAVSVAGSHCDTTEASGEYEIEELVEAQYTVEFKPSAEYFTQYFQGATSAGDATPVGVTAGTVTVNINAALQKPPSGPGRFTGTVTAAATGLPVTGVQVCAEQVGVAGSRCETTSSGGGYVLENLPAGEWLLRFKAQGSGQNLLSLAYPNKEIWEPPTPITLSPGGHQIVDIALKSGGQITGTVRLAATGAPTAGVRVCLTEAQGFSSLACLTTPSSGAYRFLAVWPGNFKVVFSAAAGEFPDSTPITDAYATQWWSGQSTYAAATPIVVVPPATVAGVDALLTPLSSSAPAPVSAPATVSAARAKSKLRKCRKGYVRRKVKKKLRCVKRHHKKHHKKRHKKSA